ncbi:MAG: ABC transporter ATP-binding protein [Thermoanaerobaculia bacterium]
MKAITSHQLGKRYNRTAARNWHRTLRDAVSGADRRAKSVHGEEEFWALRDASFEIAVGEVVGIVGKNGAGKTTLLRLLARITEPTEGEAEVNGRVGSLLDVGTGFHYELTGRENILLSGAILGMTRREVSARFDEIVAYAEVGEFLDTQIKRYSSGMVMRLAFAVAAHLQHEILLLDEILSVGDAEFQRKCMTTIEALAKSGRTVLFVSHNADAVRRLCPRSILLENGRIVVDDKTESVMARYETAAPCHPEPALFAGEGSQNARP